MDNDDSFAIKDRGGLMRKGFTMAEVLITLGIIGIVASMTMPMLIAKHRSKVLESQFQKRYSELSQAITMLKSKDEYVYGMYDGPRFSELLVKQYTGAKAGPGGIYHGVVSEQKRVLGFELPVYKTFNKGMELYKYILDDGFIYLNQEFFIYINADSYSVTAKTISIDVNGSKGPNIAGYDLFFFKLDEKDTLRLYSEDETYCSPTDTSDKNGLSCSYFAVTDKNYFSKLSW